MWIGVDYTNKIFINQMKCFFLTLPFTNTRVTSIGSTVFSMTAEYGGLAPKNINKSLFGTWIANKSQFIIEDLKFKKMCTILHRKNELS